MKIQGRNLIVKKDDTAIACARSCELDISADVAPVADPDSGAWTKCRAGKKNWSITVSGLVNVSSGISSLTGLAGTTVALKFVNTSGDEDEVQQGSAICKNIKLTGTIQNLAQYTATFQGSGPLASIDNQA